MNSLAVHRAIIGVLALALIVAVWYVRTARVDGDPSGLDIVSKATISLKVQENGGGLLCLRSGSACDVQVEMHYLSSPPPNCTDTSASGCSVLDQPRMLPACNAANEDLCLSAAPAPAVAPSPTPLTVQVQDDDGWRTYDSNGQFIITLTAPGTTRHKPH
jgi:hypothetical protein